MRRVKEVLDGFVASTFEAMLLQRPHLIPDSKPCPTGSLVAFCGSILEKRANHPMHEKHRNVCDPTSGKLAGIPNPCLRDS